MLAIAGRSPGTAGFHTLRNLDFGDIVAGTTTYTLDVSNLVPNEDTIVASGTTAPRYWIAYINNVHLFDNNAAAGTTIAVADTGVITFTITNAQSTTYAGQNIRIYISIAVTISATDVHIYPADRCVWTQEVNPNGGYTIDDAQFFGLGTTATNIISPRLGFIGKSGRFVEMTEEA